METDKKLNVNIDEQGDIIVISFADASITNSERINNTTETINDYLDKNEPRFAVVNFSEVKFFSSQVLGLLLSIRKRLEDRDGKVVISAIDPKLYRVFRITNLDKIFEFYDNKDQAVKSLSQ
jgi:anti-sigma B factor antagonist